jgi:D-alanine transaminase
MADVLYFNGRFTTTDERVLGVEDRGFQFGDGVYEVLKFLRKRPIFAAEHFGRMQAGLEFLEIPSPWTEAGFHDVCAAILDRTTFSDGTLYFQVTRGERERVHYMPVGMTPTAIAYSRRFAFPDASKKLHGARVITTPDTRWKTCRVKSVNLLGNVIAKTLAHRAGADEAIMVEGGEVREGSSSSFFAIRERRIITHPNVDSILPGIVRDRVVTLALESQILVDERPLRETELFSLDEAFITSTTQGVMPVTAIDGRAVGNDRRGEITELLQAHFDELERREVEG